MIEKHLWADITAAPDGPGVYAWYYSPQITEFDLNRLVDTVHAAPDSGAAEREVSAFLDQHLFQYFKEDPYETSLSGPLKPSYKGYLEHDISPSANLVGRLAAEPERMRALRRVLALSAPMFASPLYIGMARGLKKRLAKHQSLIERYRSMDSRDGQVLGNADAGFAWRVAQRKIPPERLFVYTCSIESGEGVSVDVENILNRICYPILGRN